MSVNIKYGARELGTLRNGQTATLKCKDKLMESDVEIIASGDRKSVV